MDAKSLGFFTLGSLFGVLGGVIAVKKYYQRRSDEEIAEIKRVYTYKKPVQGEPEWTMKISRDENMQSVPDISPEEVKQKVEEAKKLQKLRKEAVKIIDYSGYAQDDDPIEDENDEDIDPAELEYPVDDDSETDEPYEIDPGEAGKGIECVSTIYYVNNNVMAEAESMESIDISKTIGQENLEKCLERWKEDSDDVLYFRNRKIGLDYEVLKSDEDYNGLMRALHGTDE